MATIILVPFFPYALPTKHQKSKSNDKDIAILDPPPAPN
jgi:hypothetical protein